MRTRLVTLLLIAAATLSGSTITSVFQVTGTTYTVAVTDFSTTGADMVGLVVTANYTSGTSLTCTWTAAGSCTSAGGFTVTYPAANSTHPLSNNSNWIITNSLAGSTLASITFNGIPGLTAFDRCMTGVNTFNDNNPGFLPGLNCSEDGTTGSDLGYSVGTGNTSGNGGAGTAGITGTVTYMNALHLASSSIVGDWWGQFTITFGGPTAFTSGATFTFRSDSDTLSSAYADIPEPGTFGLAGFALFAFGFALRKHRR